MNTLVVYKTPRGNKNSYYKFLRKAIERYALENETGIYQYRKDYDAKQYPDRSILMLRMPDKTGLSLGLWYKFTLPAIVNKLNVDKIIYLNVPTMKKSGVEQFMCITDVAFTSARKALSPHEEYLKKNFIKSIPYAKSIITYSQFAANQLKALTKEDVSDKIKVVYGAAEYQFMEKSFNEKEIRKDILTNGEDFFLAKIKDNNEEQLVNVLKAFSVFKNWQKSSMKLVLTGLENGISNHLKRKYTSYKFQNDVVILEEEHIDIYPEILSAAYAFFNLTDCDSDTIPLVEAMRSHTMLLAYNLPSTKEIADDYYKELLQRDFNYLGNIMIEIYKDEDQRDIQVAKAGGFVQEYDYEIIKEDIYKMLDYYSF